MVASNSDAELLKDACLEMARTIKEHGQEMTLDQFAAYCAYIMFDKHEKLQKALDRGMDEVSVLASMWAIVAACYAAGVELFSPGTKFTIQAHNGGVK